MFAKKPIIPGDLTRTTSEFEERLTFAREYAGAIHIDVADGQFVDSTTLPISEWPALNIPYAETHLMVKEPTAYLEVVKKAGAIRAIVHIESFFDLDELADRARELDLLLGFAVNPDTDLEKLKPFLEISTYVQVMGIEPGQTGRAMVSQTPLAVSYLRKIPSKRLTISVDGGVHRNTILSLAKAGANYYIASSALYDHGSWPENYQHMLDMVENV